MERESAQLPRSLPLTSLCWNIGNPSPNRVGSQASWLIKQSADVLVLTECKRSKGCLLLERYLQAFGYHVIFPKPEGNEYGVLIASKHQMSTSSFADEIDFLRSRVASAEMLLPPTPIEIIATYVPSRDASHEKKEKKKRFLNHLLKTLEQAPDSHYRILCGDFNVVEPGHVPHYQAFEEWEYAFYSALPKYQLRDAFRHLNPTAREYSWVGRTGNGYRYDHYFVSASLLPLLRECRYLHEPRETGLSDHSAMMIRLSP